MYQLEVKYHLINNLFNPKDGWDVLIDIDAMERGKGNQQKPDKIQLVTLAEERIREMGVRIGKDPLFGRIDILAQHKEFGIFLIEVEGKSTKQKDQGLYSTLGQLIKLMTEQRKGYRYGIAFPDEPKWEIQLTKVPLFVREQLNIDCFLVSENGVRKI